MLTEPWPRSTERRGPLTRPQAMGRDRRAGRVTAHAGLGPRGECRGRRASGGPLANRPEDWADPGRGKEEPDPRIAWGFDVTPHPRWRYPPFTLALPGFSYRQAAVAGLVYVLPIAVAENVGAAVLCGCPFGG